MKRLGIYHSRDLDGKASGAVLLKKYPDIELIGYDYGEKFDYDKLSEVDEVYMIDVSMKPDKMMEIAKLVKQFIYIDHHKSAIDEMIEVLEMEKVEYGDRPSPMYYEFNKENFKMISYIGIGACELAWHYLLPNEALPNTLALLSQYDVWNKKGQFDWEADVMPFQYAMRSTIYNPSDLLYYFQERNHNSLYRNIIEKGNIVLDTIQKTADELVVAQSFEMEFYGLRALCLNTTLLNSLSFEKVFDESKHDIMIPFMYKGKDKLWTVSLYTTKDDIDCSVIAKKFGGGGHKKAAGFQIGKGNLLTNIEAFINWESNTNNG